MVEETSMNDALRVALASQDALTAYAYGILRDWSLAEDAVQDSLLAVHRGANVRPGASLHAWLRGIVRHKAIDVIRRRGRETAVADEVLATLVERAFDQYLEERAVAALASRKQKLRDCMAKLPGDALRLVLAFYRDRQPAEALAQTGSQTANAVRLRLQRIRHLLRDCVAGRRNEARGAA